MRYRVLYALDHPGQSVPCGIAIDEAQHGVRVIVPWEMGIAERQSEPYTLTGPDLEPITYVPGDPGYFDQIMHDLGRTFAMGPVHDTEQPATLSMSTDERRNDG